MSNPARGGFILLARFVAVTGINYLFALALAWLLAPAEFGEVAVLQAIILLAAMVLNSGFPWMLAWTLAGSERGDEAARVFRTSLVGNVLFGVLLALVVIAIDRSGALGMGADFGTPVIIAALTLPVLALSSVGRGALHGSGRFGGIAIIQTGDAALRCALGLILVGLVGIAAQAVALAFLVGVLFATVTAAWLLRDLAPGRGRFAPLSAYARTLPIFAAVAGVALLLTLDIVTLKAVGEAAGVTAATVALYQAGAMLARAPYFIGDALMDAIFPYMVLRKDSSARSHGYFSAAVRWIALAVLPLEIVLIVRPEPLLGLFFPASYGAAAPLLRLLAIGSIGVLGAGIFSKALQALGKRTAAAVGTVGALAVELGLIAALVPSFGAEGAATAFTVGAWLGALFLAVRYFQYQGVSIPAPSSLARYALALTVLSGLSLAGALFDGRRALLAIVFAFVAYAGSLLLLRLITVPELRHLGAVAAGLVPLRHVWLRRAVGRSALRKIVVWLFLRPRLALAVVVAPVAFLVVADNVIRSPDTLYDEVVYTETARNVAAEGDLTYSESPLFVHPPLYFLLQGAWLRLTGVAESGIFEAIHNARYLTSALTALVICLIALLAFEFSPRATTRRRFFLASAAAALAAFDPVLLRFGRVGMIESLAVLTGLLTLYVGWRWRRRSAVAWVSVVGLLTGLSLLVKEITIFLVIVPLLFALMRRNWPLVGRSLVALAIGVAAWSTFAGWAVALGLGRRFVEVKLLTFERLLGLLQTTGWNRPTVSFLDALRVSASQYFPSYLLLACGAAVLVWLGLRRSEEIGSYLAAWLLATYAFGAYTVARGQLNEQFFTYLIPGAIVATVLGAEAVLVGATRSATRSAALRRRAWQFAAVLPLGAALLLASVGGANWWRLYHRGSDRGIEQMTTFVPSAGPPCTAFNASGDVEKYAFSLTGRRVTNFGSGPLAATRGVRFFFFSPKDVWAQYGKMNADLEAWLRRFGSRVVGYPSHTYWGVELWRVDYSPFDATADVQPIRNGLFVNVHGSACGGYRVVNSQEGAFLNAYRNLGGKPLVGRPLSRTWQAGRGAFQVFDTLMLRSVPALGGGWRSVAPTKLVSFLEARAAEVLPANDLPRPQRLPPRTVTGVRSLLTDPLIARAYVGTDPDEARRADWKAAREHWGAPLGRPLPFRGGFVRQPFERVVFERRMSDPRYGVRLARGVGQAAIQAGIVPSSARRVLPVPNLEERKPPKLPTSAKPFLVLFSGFLLVFTGVMLTLGARRVSGILSARVEKEPSAEAPTVSSAAVLDVSSAAVLDGAGSAANANVHLNSATVDELESLPGIGTATATRILGYREANGPFRSVADLQRVRGIGPARLERLRELVEP
jgi:competence ComEA-like helix-hairpin-helix protein